MKIVTLASLKGGVGKTTLAIHLAVLAARSGKRVLLCDADANNNATDFLLDDVAGEAIDAANLLHVLINRRAPADCIFRSRFRIDVLPATVELSELSVHTNANPVLLFSLRATLLATDYD
ncbi:MAG: AAA family ATPase, partial [Spirochaetales bacterium]|nr:AAA family ATPase [Spirochaetales bacterium]